MKEEREWKTKEGQKQTLRNCSRCRPAYPQACYTVTLAHTRPLHTVFRTTQALSCIPSTLCCTANARPRAALAHLQLDALFVRENITLLIINAHYLLNCIVWKNLGEAGSTRDKRLGLRMGLHALLATTKLACMAPSSTLPVLLVLNAIALHHLQCSKEREEKGKLLKNV
eukprot:4890451-Pleurochrysis_carterae.AAC.2